MQRQGGNPQGGGQVGQAGIQAHHQAGLAQFLHQFRERQGQRRRAPGLGDALRSAPFRRIAPGQGHLQPRIPRPPRQIHPHGFRPQLARPTGAVQKQAKVRARGRRRQPKRQGAAVFRVLRLAGSAGRGRRRPECRGRILPIGVAQGAGKQLTLALDGMAALGYCNAPVVEPGGGRLPGRGSGKADLLLATRAAGHQGAFQQPLGIHDQIVAFLGQALEECPQLPARLPKTLAPAPPSNGQHPLHPRMKGWKSGERLFRNPVEPRLPASGLGEGRQGMHQIPQGRHLDQQDLHGPRIPGGFRTGPPKPVPARCGAGNSGAPRGIRGGSRVGNPIARKGPWRGGLRAA